MAVSRDGHAWDNVGLLEELRGSEVSSDAGQWSIWNWRSVDSHPTRLEITITVPVESRDASTTHEFMHAVGRQLKRAFGLFADERSWPLPPFRLLRKTSTDDDWAYSVSLPGGPKAAGQLKPAKLLVMGEEHQMATLLGLETLDPILGLPAKWIARSQLATAQSAEIHVFDGPGLVSAHTLHLIGDSWHRCFGFLEVQRWLLDSLPGHNELLAAIIPRHAGLLMRVLRELIADLLWLPHPAVFLEHFSAALPEMEVKEIPLALCGELMRKEILPLNIERFCDDEGILHAVEWRGEPEGDNYDHLRMIVRLAAALPEFQSNLGTVVVVTDFETRLGLSQVLRATFPHVPILSWTELPGHTRVNVVAVVNAQFEVDPSPWPHLTYEVAMGKQ